MAGLVQRIEVEPARGGGDRAGQVAGRLVRRGESVQDAQHGPLDGDGARRPPIVEVRAVAQVEARPGTGRGRGPAAAASERRPSERGESLELREVDAHAIVGSSATRARSTRTVPPPDRRAEVDSVRRSAPRAADSSASGHSRAASSSRANARPSAARSARMAIALRVSTTSGRAVHQDLRRPEESDVEARRALAVTT